MSTPESNDVVHVLPSILQVLVVGPLLDKKYDGREYKTQQLECLALDADGQPLQVGVIRVPKHLQGLVKVGYYRPVFGMRVGRERVIESVILDLTPYKPAAAPATVKGAAPVTA